MARPNLVRSVFVVLLSFLVAGIAAAAPHHTEEGASPLGVRIAADVESRQITFDDGVMLRALAIAQIASLPVEYRQEMTADCGTPLMLELAVDLPKADPRVRDFVKYVLSAPSVRRKVTVPDLTGAPVKYEALGRKALHDAQLAATAANILLTTHFEIDYQTAGADAITLAQAQTIGSILEQSYATFMGTHGFTAPVAPADGLINVVPKEIVPCPVDLTGTIPCGPSLLGAAVPLGLTFELFGDPVIYIKKTLASDQLQVTLAHELFHLIQYETAGVSQMIADLWWCEGSATAMEDIAYPSINRYFSRIPGFFNRTAYPINTNTYESVLFHKFMMEKYAGGSPVVLHDIMDTWGFDGLQAIRAVLASSYSTDLDHAMQHFALWNFLSGARTTPPNSYVDSGITSPVPFPTHNHFQDTHMMSNAVPSVPVRNVFIQGTGANYYQFRPDPSLTAPRKLTIKVTGSFLEYVRGWIVIRRQNNTTDVRDLSIGAGTPNVALEFVNDFSYSNVGEVVLILSSGDGSILPSLATYEAKLATSIDIAFAMDTTGSMSGSISAIKSTATQAMSTLGANGADFRIAVTEFKDHPVSPYGSPGDFPYRANSPFSNQGAVITGGLNMLFASGGNDWPESQYSGIMGAINAQGIGPWRADAKKSIIVMTDAPPHNPEPFTGYTAASVAAAAAAGGITVASSSPRVATMSLPGVEPLTQPRPVAPTAGNPIRVYGIIVGGDYEAYASLSQLAEATGGKVYTATYNINDIIEALMDAIGDIGDEEPPSPPANNAPNVSAAIASPSQLWPANGKMMPIAITNVSDADGDAFTINVTAITQDEPVNAKAGKGNPDATGVGTSGASIRAERYGTGNGRRYTIVFAATDARGASSSGSVTVCVPHDQGGNTVCTDDGQLYDSTKP